MNIMETMMIWRYGCNLLWYFVAVNVISYGMFQQVHFRTDHFLCEDETCLAKKFIVFQIEAELKVSAFFFTFPLFDLLCSMVTHNDV